MKLTRALILTACLISPSLAQQSEAPSDLIQPSRPVAVGKAPGMLSKTLKDGPDGREYAIVFYKGDEAMSGLTDFAIKNHIKDAHFTAIGAISGATLAWLEPDKKIYHRIDVDQQVEVLSLTGDIATFDGKPIVHMHCVLGRRDGSTVGGHIFELHVNPTLEVFMSVNTRELKKRPDDASGMKLIDPRE